MEVSPGCSRDLQSRVLAHFWESVGLDRMHLLNYEVRSFFTQPDEAKDPGVVALETEFDEMLNEGNGGWI